MFSGTFVVIITVIATVVSGQPPDLELLEPNEENDDMHPVNFHLTTEDEKKVIVDFICKGWPCPDYDIIADHSFVVQERKYPTFQAISATVQGCSNFSEGLYSGYSALFRYRRGLNAENRTINMSVPVIVEISKTDNEDCEETYKVFYLAKSGDANVPLPKPIQDNVKVEQTTPFNVYVHTFSGRFDNPEPERTKLLDNLQNLNLCFGDSRYFVVMYDPPWRKYGRRNEIWLDVRICNDGNETSD